MCRTVHVRTAEPHKTAKIKVVWKLGPNPHTTNPEMDSPRFLHLSPEAHSHSSTTTWSNCVFLSEQKFQFFRRWERHCKVLSQTNGHTTANIMALGSPADSLSVVSLPSCPICYCLISSAKEPLPCQLSVPSVLHKMAAAQQPSTALLPGTRLPSLPQSANTGSHCWQSQDFITTTLTSAGLFVISLLSWFWLYNHLPLIPFASVLLLTDFTLHINLPLACCCICSLFYY